MTTAIGVPNVADRTVYADTRRRIVTALLVAFVIRTVAAMSVDKKTKRYDAKNVVAAVQSANVPAWVVVAAVLMMASDFDATSRLAMGFSVLLLVAVVLVDGEPAIKNVNRFVNPPAPKPSTKKEP